MIKKFECNQNQNLRPNLNIKIYNIIICEIGMIQITKLKKLKKKLGWIIRRGSTSNLMSPLFENNSNDVNFFLKINY